MSTNPPTPIAQALVEPAQKLADAHEIARHIKNAALMPVALLPDDTLAFLARLAELVA